MIADSPDTQIQDDGLINPVVGEWALEKHKKIGYYASLFSVGMRHKWDCRLYIDLFAGAGTAKLKKSDRLIKGSPMLVLGLDVPFDKYIFCEQDPELCDALRSRVGRFHPELDTVVLNIDCNKYVGKIINILPTFSRSYKGIAFCFVDPFNASNLSFDTLRRLSAEMYVDFAVLLPSHMDIHRNQANYTRDECHVLDDLLGESGWRQDWAAKTSKIKDFGVFIADRFGRQMKTLGYLYDGPEDFVTVRMGGEDTGLYLYKLCFFSRHPRGREFWKESLARTTNQLTLGI